MLESHQTFEHPQNPNQKIWRYIDFTKLIDLLNSESIYFTRADFFEDIFEGSVTRPTVARRTTRTSELIEKGILNPMYTPEWWNRSNEEAKKEFAINCWHMNDQESAAMWRLYVQSNEGIAIQSTFNRLKKCFHESNISILAGVVKYIDYDNDLIDFGNSLEPYVRKRKSFAHENELRFVIWQPGYGNSNKVNLDEGGISIKIDLSILIENIYVSPNSTSWFTRLVQDVAKKYGLTSPIINSRLSEKPLF